MLINRYLIWNESLESDVFDGHVFSGVALLPKIKTDCFTLEPIQNAFNLSK